MLDNEPRTQTQHPGDAIRMKAEQAARRMNDATISQAFVPRTLRGAAEIYEQRNKLYGDNYKRFGIVMAAMFPNGCMLKTADDWNRMGVLIQIMSKQTRYANLFHSGGHNDSLDDNIVYTAMLKELDDELERGEG